MQRLTKEEIETLILIAATKLQKYNDLIKNEQDREKAIHYFERNSQALSTGPDLANVALLSVVSVYTTGTIHPEVRYNWGNRTGVADQSPSEEGSAGGSTLDEVNRIDYRYGQDNLGIKARVIANYLNAGEFSPAFIEALQANGMLLNPSSTIPKPEPK